MTPRTAWPLIADAARSWSAARRLAEVDTAPGGNYFLIVALAVPAQQALRLSPAHAASSLIVLFAFAALYLTSQAIDLSRPTPARAGLYLAMVAITMWGTVEVGSEWIVAGAMTAAACANLFPLVVGSASAAAVVAIAEVVATYDTSAGLIVGAAGAIAILRGRLLEEIARTRSQRRALAAAAVDSERLRIARDLHDLLGHSLVTMVMKAELAERLVTRDPEAAAAAARDVQVVGREATVEVHDAVTGYRSGALAQELERSRRALDPVDTTVTVAPRSWSSEVDGLLAWTVRECTTNVLRHADATRCDIVVVRDVDQVALTFVNNDRQLGSGSWDQKTGGYALGGNGLRGLDERTRELGGSLESGLRSNGNGGTEFAVIVRVPADAHIVAGPGA